jgi:hypothetical protein
LVELAGQFMPPLLEITVETAIVICVLWIWLCVKWLCSVETKHSIGSSPLGA